MGDIMEDSLIRGLKSLSLGLGSRNDLQPTPLAVQPSTIVALEKVHGKGARFKSVEQGQLVEAVCRAEEHVLGILPTGGGKTDSLIIPCLKRAGSGKLTVVLVPLVPLAKDLKRRFEAQNIETAIWRSGVAVPPGVQILLANFEAVRTPDFHAFLIELAIAGMLELIGVDECDYPITNMDFRPGMARLSTLMTYGVPMVLLTGTLPRNQKVALLEIYGLSSDTVREIRTETVRPNLSYNVVHDEDSDDQMMLQQLKVALKTNFNREGLGLIYVRTVEQVQAVADYLAEMSKEIEESLEGIEHVGDAGETSGLAIFRCFSGLGATKKTVDMETWEKWDHRTRMAWMVTTPYLGRGLDLPNVTHVIHIGCPSNYLEFAQESGRAGRSGQLSYSTILINHIPGYPETDLGGRGPLITSLTNGLCLRYQLQAYLDGTAYTCLSQPNHVQLCKNCREGVEQGASMLHTPEALAPPRVGPMITATAEVAAANAMTNVEHDLSSFLRQLGKTCAQHYVCGAGPPPVGHGAGFCPLLLPHAHATQEAIWAFKSRLGEVLTENGKMKKLTNYCAICLLPQTLAFHQSLPEKEGPKKGLTPRGSCRYKDQSGSLLYLATEDVYLGPILEDYSGVSLDNEDAYIAWLTTITANHYRYIDTLLWINQKLGESPIKFHYNL